ncbi:MAG: helix-turn-helix domain-containing protein, partial [Bariatricus sp.]|nr:helix-turn-helix domain-containing protein [Bariatricus sp.]
SFMDAANLLGIHNSNLYEIWRRENLETITVDSVKRIPVDVFERWYENQIMYQKADRMPTLTDLEADFIPLQEAADLLGITKEKLSVITRASRYKDIFEIRVYDNKKWISKKSFQQFLNAQNVYQVIKEPEKEMSTREESMETKEFISRQEAAALAGVTSGTITKWVQLERFPCVGAGRVLRIYRKEFLQWLKEYQEGGV